MSVRATDRLIGDAVIVSVLPKSPPMVVKAVNKDTSIITTSWFSAANEYQEGTFPASALDRAEPNKSPQTGKPARKKK